MTNLFFLAQRFEFVTSLGEGAYGQVWKCLDKEKNVVVAMKRFKEAHLDEEVMRLVMREIRLLKASNHPNVVKLHEAFKSKSGRVYMVMENVENTLTEQLRKCPFGFSPQNVKLIMWQLLQATAFLHSNRIIHRDLKPANILLTEDHRVKLCDFGFARTLKPTDIADYTQYVVTRWYRPPELLVGGAYGSPADVWALGCLFGEMATGRPVFPGRDTLDQLWLTMRSVGPLPRWQMELLSQDEKMSSVQAPAPLEMRPLNKKFALLDSKMMEVLRACLQPEPVKRPTALQIMALPYFDDIHQLLGGTQLQQEYDLAYAAALKSQSTAPAQCLWITTSACTLQRLGSKVPAPASAASTAAPISNVSSSPVPDASAHYDSQSAASTAAEASDQSKAQESPDSHLVTEQVIQSGANCLDSSAHPSPLPEKAEEAEKSIQEQESTYRPISIPDQSSRHRASDGNMGLMGAPSSFADENVKPLSADCYPDLPSLLPITSSASSSARYLQSILTKKPSFFTKSISIGASVCKDKSTIHPRERPVVSEDSLTMFATTSIDMETSREVSRSKRSLREIVKTLGSRFEAFVAKPFLRMGSLRSAAEKKGRKSSLKRHPSKPGLVDVIVGNSSRSSVFSTDQQQRASTGCLSSSDTRPSCSPGKKTLHSSSIRLGASAPLKVGSIFPVAHSGSAGPIPGLFAGCSEKIATSRLYKSSERQDSFSSGKVLESALCTDQTSYSNAVDSDMDHVSVQFKA
ncbi:hypothetical protein CEUSTIGMA_g1756.t1 [Chlamydomonas eustigma]|uniref:cyclin-dependent kinase n=1 Tax=Chlamydomonas eustigma TaxID=1157962 RepID=A0A250WTZ7_9CHLO|nr:hypothetical protein CEUSTIGMA_g1756.t1 [Chlamydomonas eustigma]|eukprot:GAX74307.1 hypothetical protein CEUSTIGMA_g1756.t1 [Chlamydomonas eustigma]